MTQVLLFYRGSWPKLGCKIDSSSVKQMSLQLKLNIK